MHRFRFALVVRPGSSLLIALWASLSVTAPVAAQDAGTLPGAATPVQRLSSAEARAKSAACTAGCHQDLKAVEHPAHKELACTQCHANVTNGQVKHERALDQLPPEKTCAGCHPEETRRQTSGLHKDLLCENCHGSAHGAFKRNDSSSCKGCHGDQVKATNASIHGTSEKQRVRCMDCHGDLHDVKKSSNPLAPSSKVLQVTTCGECHDTQHVRAFRTSVHGQGLLRSGLAVAPTCSTCHGAHDITKVKSETSKVAKVNSVETCGKCHEFIVSRWRESTHGQKWLFDKDPTRVKPGAEPETPAAERPTKYPVCVDCHSGHETFDPMVYANNLKMADTCGACHEEASRTYRESFHGKATRLGQAAAATCADCHTPHYMLPATDPRSTVQPKNLAATCGRCHPGASGEFLKFDVHANPDSKARNAKVYWIYKFMTLLLFGVMGFFALHALLWLQRALVAAWRHELPKGEKPGEPWVRRFRPIHMGIHVAIVLTFLTLGATGLPLKFSGQGWARPIESLFGGPAANQLLHRIAGVLTFGYAAVFLAYLLYEALAKRTKGMFWGWAVDDSPVEGPSGPVGQLQVVLLPGQAAAPRPLGLLGEVRLLRGLLGHPDDRHLGPDAVGADVVHEVPARLGAQRGLRHPQRRGAARDRLHLLLPLLPHPPASGGVSDGPGHVPRRHAAVALPARAPRRVRARGEGRHTRQAAHAAAQRAGAPAREHLRRGDAGHRGDPCPSAPRDRNSRPLTSSRN